MIFLIGLFLVFGSITLGYTMHYGDLRLLWQPNELIIILGAGLGAFVLSNPYHILKRCIYSMRYLFRSRPYSKRDYTEMLVLMFNLCKILKTKGPMELESHIENPRSSEFFRSASSVVRSRFVTGFICDNMRLIVMGVSNLEQMDEAMSLEIQTHADELNEVPKAFLTLGDSFPALGIVAAVLGVIVTMRSILEPPEILGGSIAAALVGTFTGVLLCYGLFSPMGYYIGRYSNAKISYVECIKVGIMAAMSDLSADIVVEMMRKTIPNDIRPTFAELDRLIGGSKF